MADFYTSDLHLGHERISELAGRPFGSVEEMDAVLIERWNQTVSRGDTVYILGDLAMGKLEESLAKVKTLNGTKYLVPGNHDRVSTLYKGSERKKSEWNVAYREAGLRILLERWPSVVGDRRVLLCHFPYEGDSHDVDRYAEARPQDLGLWLIHGHVHEKWKVNGRQVNVGVDVWDFTPVPEDALAELLVYKSS